jgi:hypothetical protein
LGHVAAAERAANCVHCGGVRLDLFDIVRTCVGYGRRALPRRIYSGVVIFLVFGVPRQEIGKFLWLTIEAAVSTILVTLELVFVIQVLRVLG